jgi:hypothetical protein
MIAADNRQPAAPGADSTRWYPVRNVGANDLPPRCLLAISGLDADGTLTVDVPSADGQTVGILVNGLHALPVTVLDSDGVPTAGYGQAHSEFPAVVAYDGGSGEVPAIGDTWGVEAGSVLLASGKAGFLVLSDPDTDSELVLVTRSQVGTDDDTWREYTADPAPDTVNWPSVWTCSGNVQGMPVPASVWPVVLWLDGTLYHESNSVPPEERFKLINGVSVAYGFTTTAGSAVCTGGAVSGLFLGMSVYGSTITGAAKILSIDSGTQITLNLNATGNGIVTLTFTGGTFTDTWAWCLYDTALQRWRVLAFLDPDVDTDTVQVLQVNPGTPPITASSIEFDHADGFNVTDLGAGTALIGFTGGGVSIKQINPDDGPYAVSTILFDHATGASLSGGTTVILEPATPSQVGTVTITTQEFAGAKTFDDGVQIGLATAYASLQVYGSVLIGDNTHAGNDLLGYGLFHYLSANGTIDLGDDTITIASKVTAGGSIDLESNAFLVNGHVNFTDGNGIPTSGPAGAQGEWMNWTTVGGGTTYMTVGFIDPGFTMDTGSAPGTTFNVRPVGHIICDAGFVYANGYYVPDAGSGHWLRGVSTTAWDGAVLTYGIVTTAGTGLPAVGPGPGTYTVGARLTGGGTDGQIQIDAEGRIVAITQAT